VQNKPEKKWFLILNRSPRGPFTETEINELLGQGLIRHNDLALLQEEGTPGSWKFLWQFSEFDSRKKEKVPPPPEILEKRKPRTEEQIQEELEKQIPLDLKSISFDDLIIRAKPRQKKESDNLLVSSRSSFGGGSEEKTRQSQNSALMKMVPLLLFIAAVSGMLLTQKTSVIKTTPSDLKGAAPRGVATKSEKTLPKARKSESPSAPILSEKTNIPAPQERDRGQVREEEILRLREAEKLKELEERARREREKERELIDEDEEESRSDEYSKENREPTGQSESEEEQNDNEEERQTPKKKRKVQESQEGRDPDDQEEPSWWLED